MLLCHVGEISSSVVFIIIIITTKRRGCSGWGWGVVSVMWVCASLGCEARVGVYRCICPVWVSGLLSVLHRCVSLMSVSYGFCGKERNNKICVLVCVGW